MKDCLEHHHPIRLDAIICVPLCAIVAYKIKTKWYRGYIRILARTICVAY